MSKYRVYPSGFVGSDAVDFGIIDASQTDMLMKVGLFKTRLSDTKEQKYCKLTEALYNKFYGKNMDMANLTELMRLAYKHIGDSPLAWLKRHNDVEYKKYGQITRYHAEFICETINYAAKNIDRKMSMQSWQKYLTYASDDSTISSSSAYKRIIGDSYIAKMSTCDFIANWLAMPAGQQDILQTLKLMYGKVLETNHI